MSHNKTNIVLIGMPGSGKSTLGKKLARSRGMQFVDTDDLLELDQNMHIQEIVNRRGVMRFRDIENEVLSKVNVNNHVIATGGSAVYGKEAMAHLGDIGVRVYLKISLTTLVSRVDNVASRGLAKMKNHSLPRLYHERIGLYDQVADLVFANDRPVSAVAIDQLNSDLDSLIKRTA